MSRSSGSRRTTPLNLAVLLAGLAFLYGPIGLVVIYSFNGSRLVSVWGGFSLRWYEGLSNNGPLLDALAVSLRVALASAAIATVLGTLSAFALARAGRFAGRSAFMLLLLVPLALPEVVSGLSLLLLLVALGVERGEGTITIAHATLSIPFVTLVVQARLVGLDRALEEAARDLGATPLGAVATVTLPLLAPAIGSGFLLAFTLSLDDLVLASFASGPGATTLPMLVFSQVRRGVTPEINAVATLLIGFAALVLVVAALASRRSPGRARSVRPGG